MGARGFTLLELLVVLAIIGVVLAFIPGFVLRSQPGLDVDVAARSIAVKWFPSISYSTARPNFSGMGR